MHKQNHLSQRQRSLARTLRDLSYTYGLDEDIIEFHIVYDKLCVTSRLVVNHARFTMALLNGGGSVAHNASWSTKLIAGMEYVSVATLCDNLIRGLECVTNKESMIQVVGGITRACDAVLDKINIIMNLEILDKQASYISLPSWTPYEIVSCNHVN